MDALDALREDGRAAVGEVLPGDGSDDAVAEIELGGQSRRGVAGSSGSSGKRSARRYGAVVAAPGADVAENHEGGGAALPAIADVGAVSLLADGVQAAVAHEVAQPEVVGAAGRRHPKPIRQ